MIIKRFGLDEYIAYVTKGRKIQLAFGDSHLEAITNLLAIIN